MEIIALIAALILDIAVGARAQRKTEKLHETVTALLGKMDERLDNHEVRLAVVETKVAA